MNFLKNISKLVFFPILFTMLNHYTYGQDDRINLDHDSLSINEILKIQSDSGYSKFKIDTIHVELIYNGKIFAILPISSRSQIDQNYIKTTNYRLDSLNFNKKLLRIQLLMDFKR